MHPFIHFLIFAFVIAVCIGSFLNVVVLRAFTKESIVLPPSKCPKCHEKIKWYDNIPILSFLFLRGKCRFCKEPISIQYPIVELITGLVFVAIILAFGPSLKSVFFIVLAALGIVISVTDIKEKVVFDAHTITFIVIALIYNLAIGNIVYSLIGLACGAIVMELMARVGYAFVKKRAFGEGDTFIAAGIGALLGAKMFLLVLALSVFSQVLFILPSFLKKMWSANEHKLVIALSTFILVSFSYKVIDYNLKLNLILQLAFVAFILILGIYSCLKLTKITKSSTNLTYLPFGPSLLTMTLVVVFYGEVIFRIVQKSVF